MEKLMKLAVQLTAIDKMTPVFKTAMRGSAEELDRLKSKAAGFFEKGLSGIAAGAGLAASLAPAVNAFMDLEASSASLEVSLTNSAGVVSSHFEKINRLAIDLGTQLPGNAADFQNMMQALISSGVTAESVLGGVGKAAGFMAVNLKMDYVEAAKFAAKMKQATGTADADMLGLLDTISKIKNLGVDADEMRYAFARSAGALKVTGIQGLDAAKKMAAAYALVIRSGASGETTGTSFAAILNTMLDPKKIAAMNAEAAKFGKTMKFTDKGEFLGVENMVKELEKLQSLTAEQRVSVINALAGGGQDAQMLQTLITAGTKGYNEMIAATDAQASLEMKVNRQLTTLSAMWEAVGGTTENMLAALGETFAPELKMIASGLAKMAEGTEKLIKQYPALFKFIGLFVGLVAIMTTLAGVVSMVKAAFVMLNVVMSLNPISLIIIGVAALIAALYLLYENWDKITQAVRNSTWMATLREFFNNKWVERIKLAADYIAKLVPGMAALSYVSNLLGDTQAGRAAYYRVVSPMVSAPASSESFNPVSRKPGQTQLIFSPQITVSGAADPAGTARQINSLMNPFQNDFRQMLENYNADKKRKQL